MDQKMLQSTNKKCIKHSQKKIKFVQVNDVSNSKEDHFFYCTTCVNKDLEFKGINYLLISQIIDEGETNIIQKWPPINDYSLLDQLIQYTEEQGSSSSVTHQIKRYFTQLKEDFLRKVDLCEKKMIKKALELPLGDRSVLKKYQDISQISKLRSILIEGEKKDNELQLYNFKQFISEMESKKEQNNELLSKLLQQCNQKEQLVNFDFPNLLKDSIFSFIDQIDFFKSTNTDSNLNQQSIIETFNTNNVSKIIKLISNKSNFCSADFLIKIQQQLEELNPVLSKISFENLHQQNKNPIDFSALSEHRFELVKEFAEHQIRIQTNQEYPQSVEKSFEYKHLEKIIESNVGFLNNNLKGQLKQYLIDSYPLLKQVNFTNPTLDSNMFDFFRTLSNEEIEDIHALIKKRKILVDNEEYLLSQTNIISDKIQHTLLNFEDANEILRKYPIFDLMKKKEMNEQPLQIKLTKTNFQNGNDFIDISNDNQLSITQDSGFWLNCISNIMLEKEKKYIFRFKVLCENNQSFYIGLMESHKCEIDCGKNNNLSCYLEKNNNKIEYSGGNGIDKHLKGEKLKLSQENEIEMRVWLGGQQLEILDYPNYQYQVGLEDKYKNKLIQQNDLKLYLGISDVGMKISLTQAAQVDNFLN